MAKRKMIFHNLVKNSIAAFFAAVEIHNKPKIEYRYETVTLLMLNSWELILKAYIWKKDKHHSIFEKNGHSITLSKALSVVNDHINRTNPKGFIAIKENITLIETYRNDIAHLYSENLEPCIFALVARSALNYIEFVKNYFSKDILTDEGLFIMPLGFKLPFRPEEFLSKNSTFYSSSDGVQNIVNQILTVTERLKQDGVEDSVVLGFSVNLQSINKINNSDLLVAITSQENSDLTLEIVKQIKLSDDPSAQVMKLSDEEFKRTWKYTHKQVLAWCRDNIAGFKSNKKFNHAKKMIENDLSFVFTRRLDPDNEKSSSQKFYTELALVELKRLWEQKS